MSKRWLLIGCVAATLALWLLRPQPVPPPAPAPPPSPRKPAAARPLPKPEIAVPVPAPAPAPIVVERRAPERPTLDEILKLTGIERRHALERLGFDLATADPAEALRQLAALTDTEDRSAFLRGVFEFTATLAPANALAVAKQLPRGPDRQTALQTLAKVWAGETNLGRLALLTEKYGVEAALGHLLLEGDRKNPDLAALWAQELLVGKPRTELLWAAAYHLSMVDPQRAYALADQLAGADKDALFHRVAFGWAKTDPRAAMGWAMQTPDERLRLELQTNVLRGWATVDPASAAAMVNSLPAGEERQKVIGTIGYAWAEKDTQMALAWINSLADPAERDTAMQELRKVAPVGIGAVLRMDDDGVVAITDLIPGSPASVTGGLNPNDRILGIAQGNEPFEDVRGMELNKVVEKIRGQPGSRIRLQVAPGGETPGPSRTVEITRGQIIYKRPG
ncbi:MAG: PDZ domain-containing protein [Verrucomicrobiota bacterium]